MFGISNEPEEPQLLQLPRASGSAESGRFQHRFKHPVPPGDVQAIVLQRVISSLTFECRRQLLHEVDCSLGDVTAAALAATSCHYTLTGRSQDHLCPSFAPTKACVGSLDTERFQVFSAFAVDADRICREVLAQTWISSVEEMLNELATGSQRALESLDTMQNSVDAMASEANTHVRALVHEMEVARLAAESQHQSFSKTAREHSDQLNALGVVTSAVESALGDVAISMAKQQADLDAANQALASFLPVLSEIASLAHQATEAGWVETTFQGIAFYSCFVWAAKLLASLTPRPWQVRALALACLCTCALGELLLVPWPMGRPTGSGTHLWNVRIAFVFCMLAGTGLTAIVPICSSKARSSRSAVARRRALVLAMMDSARLSAVRVKRQKNISVPSPGSSLVTSSSFSPGQASTSSVCFASPGCTCGARDDGSGEADGIDTL